MITDGLRHWTALLFLAAAAGGVALAALYLFARVTRRAALGRAALIVGLAGAALYGGALVTVAIASEDRVLPPGAQKHICELDCHLAYSVAGIRREPASDGGTRYVVTVRVLFDAETISRRRAPDRTLAPNSRYVAVADPRGREYRGSADGLQRRLVPGESYTTDIVFDLPAGADAARLILRSADLPTPFIIGHENSLFHGETTFALPPGS